MTRINGFVATPPRQSFDGPQRSIDRVSHDQSISQAHTTIPVQHLGAHDLEKRLHPDPAPAPTSSYDGTSDSLLATIPITVLPATPDREEVLIDSITEGEKEKDKNKKDKDKEKEKEKKQVNGMTSKSSKRSTSLEVDVWGDATKTKKEKVQQLLKHQVHKGRAGITAVSRKIGHGVTRNGGLRRSNSTPSRFLRRILTYLRYTFYL